MDSVLQFLKTDGIRLDILALQISVMLIVLSVGMSATWLEATYLFRTPNLLFRAVIARNVIVPAVAIAMIKTFSFHPAVAITIGALAATPVPPELPVSLLKAGGHRHYIFGLLVSQAALSIVIVPLTIRIMDAVFAAELSFSVAAAAKIVIKTILAPLAAGMVIESLFGQKARAAGKTVARVANILLVCAVIPLLFFAWTVLRELAGEGVVAGLAAMVVAGLAAGHLLGGPDEHDRTVLALATAAAHPGMALAIAANFPQQRRLVAGAIIIYLVLRAILVIPYVRRRRRPSTPHGGDLHIPARA